MMRACILTIAILGFSLTLQAQNPEIDSVSVFSFTLEFQLTNDQGDCPTGDYLKNYGTKGKTRAQEYMYPVLEQFFIEHLHNQNIPVRTFQHLSDIKSNAYGYPSISNNKAISSGRSDYYLKIAIKDIGQVIPGQINASTGLAYKPVIIRCRLSLFDSKKNLLKESEAQFQSGEKIDPNLQLGVDLRSHRGNEREQELKNYEVCCKIAFLRAIQNF